MKKRLFILVLASVMCLLVALPALAGESEVLHLKFYSEYDENKVKVFTGFEEHTAFSVITDSNQNEILKNIDLLKENTLSPVYVSPAKWTSGWLSNEDGSWLKCKVVAKTNNGVNRYYFEIKNTGNEQVIIKSDLMIDHDKTVERNF